MSAPRRGDRARHSEEVVRTGVARGYVAGEKSDAGNSRSRSFYGPTPRPGRRVARGAEGVVARLLHGPEVLSDSISPASRHSVTVISRSATFAPSIHESQPRHRPGRRGPRSFQPHRAREPQIGSSCRGLEDRRRESRDVFACSAAAEAAPLAGTMSAASSDARHRSLLMARPSYLFDEPRLPSRRGVQEVCTRFASSTSAAHHLRSSRSRRVAQDREPATWPRGRIAMSGTGAKLLPTTAAAGYRDCDVETAPFALGDLRSRSS